MNVPSDSTLEAQKTMPEAFTYRLRHCSYNRSFVLALTRLFGPNPRNESAA
jgi:hypothetical protein